jgi:hypothetical protein
MKTRRHVMMNLIVLVGMLVATSSPAKEVKKPTPAVTRQEAQEMSRQMEKEMDTQNEVDKVLANPQVVLSAMLCEAEARKADTNQRMEIVLQDKALVAASAKAMSDIEDLKVRLIGLERFACTYYDVAVLLECLDPTTSSKMCSNPHIQASVQAAAQISANLTSNQPSKGVIPAKKTGNPFVTPWPFRDKGNPFSHILWPLSSK